MSPNPFLFNISFGMSFALNQYDERIDIRHGTGIQIAEGGNRYGERRQDTRYGETIGHYRELVSSASGNISGVPGTGRGMPAYGPCFWTLKIARSKAGFYLSHPECRRGSGNRGDAEHDVLSR